MVWKILGRDAFSIYTAAPSSPISSLYTFLYLFYWCFNMPTESLVPVQERWAFRAAAVLQTSCCSSLLWLHSKKWLWTQVPVVKFSSVLLTLLFSLYFPVLHKLRHFFFCPEEPLQLPSKVLESTKHCCFLIIQCDTSSSMNTGPELNTWHLPPCALLSPLNPLQDLSST